MRCASVLAPVAMSDSPAGRSTPLDLLTSRLSFAERPTDAEIRAAPASPAVYLLVASDGVPVQLGTTQHLRRMLAMRLAETAAARADLGEIVRGVHWRSAACAFEATWCYYRMARALRPREYRKLISFGPAEFLRVDGSCPLPEIAVTPNVWREVGEFFGPFPTSRAASAALDGLRELFDLCRYPEQWRASPRGTRCAYADMQRCDAPCDGGAPVAAMIERTRAAWRFACDGPQDWLVHATRQMTAAARALRFEEAAAWKRRIDDAGGWHAGSAGKARRAEGLRFLLALPATRRRSWKLMRFELGAMLDGPVAPPRKLRSSAAALLDAAAPDEPDDAVRMEQTWLLATLLYDDRKAIVLPLADRTRDVLLDELESRVREFRPLPMPSADPAADVVSEDHGATA